MDYSTINVLKLDSYKQVINILSKNHEIVGKISKFRNAQEQLISNQKKLVELHALLKGDTIFEKTKEIYRIDLINKTLPVITIMQIFAYDKKKKNLQRRVENLSLEYIQNCSDYQLINLSKKIWTIANKYGGYSLAFINKIKSKLNADKSKAINKLEKQYGLIPGMIRNIEEANIKFIEAMLFYEDEIKEKDKIVKKIKKVYNQTENLLINNIDRFISLLEKENPDFYKEYLNARTNLLQHEMNENEIQDELTNNDSQEANFEAAEQKSIQKPRAQRPVKVEG